MEQRLEILRHHLRLQWGELAAHLGVSRSMLDQVRKGTRQPGPKLIRRIEEAEVVSARGHDSPMSTRGKGESKGFSPEMVRENRPAYGSDPEKAQMRAELDEIRRAFGELQKLIDHFMRWFK